MTIRFPALSIFCQETYSTPSTCITDRILSVLCNNDFKLEIGFHILITLHAIKAVIIAIAPNSAVLARVKLAHSDINNVKKLLVNERLFLSIGLD